MNVYTITRCGEPHMCTLFLLRHFVLLVAVIEEKRRHHHDGKKISRPTTIIPSLQASLAQDMTTAQGIDASHGKM